MDLDGLSCCPIQIDLLLTLSCFYFTSVSIHTYLQSMRSATICKEVADILNFTPKYFTGISRIRSNQKPLLFREI